MHTDHPGRRRSIIRLEPLEDRNLLSVSPLRLAVAPPTEPVEVVNQCLIKFEKSSEPADPALMSCEDSSTGYDKWEEGSYPEDGWEWSDDDLSYCVLLSGEWIWDEELGEWYYTEWSWGEDYEFGEWYYTCWAWGEDYELGEWDYELSDWEWDGEWDDSWLMFASTANFRGDFGGEAADWSMHYTTFEFLPMMAGEGEEVLPAELYTTTVVDGLPALPVSMPTVELTLPETTQIAEDYSAIGLALGNETSTPTFPTSSSQSQDLETTLPARIDMPLSGSTSSNNSFQTSGFEDKASDSTNEISDSIVAPIDRSI